MWVSISIYKSQIALPIQCYRHEMENRSRATKHVTARPHVAQLRPELPLSRYLIYRWQGHHKACDEKVRHRQRQDQIVCYTLKVSLQQYCCYYKYISCNENSGTSVKITTRNVEVPMRGEKKEINLHCKFYSFVHVKGNELNFFPLQPLARVEMKIKCINK